MTGSVRGPRMARVFGRALLVLACIAAAVAPILEPDARNAVWVNCLTIAGYLTLERTAERRWPGRPISLLRGTLFLVCIPVVFLIAAFFIEGEAKYANAGGQFSHADGAWLVALAGLVLHAASLGGAVLAGRGRDMEATSPAEVLEGYSREFYLMVAWLVAALLAARLVLVYFAERLAPGLAYLLRIFSGNFAATFFFLGLGLRLRILSARLAAVATALVSGVVLLSGSRSDALFPFFFAALGFLVAGPIPRRKLIGLALVATPLFVVAMFMGSLVRDDERGRTGEAVAARFDELGSRVAMAGDVPAFTESSVRRMVSDAAHSVITRVPRERPFEQDGILDIPVEFLRKVAPRFNLSGISETETPRNWMLNDFGFLVNWQTSVELNLVADAWFRGGFPSLVVVGLLLGFLLQLQENLVYRAAVTRPQFTAVLLFAASGLLYVEGRDIVQALRSMVFQGLAGLILVGAAVALERRRGPAPGERVAVASMSRP